MLCGLIRDELLEVLYDEASPTTTARVQEHLAACDTCREEMAGLRGLRRDLAEWKLPAERPVFARAAAVPPRKAVWFAALAAGLLIALGAALGLSGSELRYEKGELAFRLGRGDADLRRLIAEQEDRHREEIRALAASFSPPAAPEEGAILSRVEELIHQSEARQTALLTASLTGFSARTEAQRRYDLARVSAGLSYLDGKNGEQVARTTELMGYVLQASQKR